MASPMPLPSTSSRGLSVWNIPNTRSRKLLGNARSVVGHDELDRIARGFRLDHDASVRRPVVVLDGVADEVLQGLGERRPGSLQRRQGRIRRDGEALGRADQDSELLDERLGVHHVHRRVGPPRPGVGQQVVQKAVEPTHSALQQFHVREDVPRQGALQILLDPADEVLDAAQRRLEVVGGHVGELFQFLVRTAQVDGMAGEAPLQALALGDVGVRPVPVQDAPVRTAVGRGQRQEPAVPAVGASKRERVLPGLAGPEGLGDAAHHALHMVGVVHVAPAHPRIWSMVVPV